MGAVALVLTGGAARAQFYEFSFPGNSSFDGWENMNSSTFIGFGGFPGGSAWPGPAGSNTAGSGDAGLYRLGGEVTTNSVKGGPFFATESLYFGSLSQVHNSVGGTLRVADDTPVAGLRTIVFQIQIGGADDYDFHLPSGVPSLKLNGSSEGMAPAATAVLNRYQNGTYFSPETEQEEPIFVNTWGFEWHLPEEEVTSFAIDFSAVTHAQIYRMQLDQSSTVTSAVFLPEMAMGERGTPAFNGATTSVTNSFNATPGALLKVEYREDLSSGSWISAGLHAVENDGSLSVPVTAGGDRRAEWSRRMFFRAYHPASP